MLRITRAFGLALAIVASLPQAALAQEEGGEQLDEAARLTFEQARQEFVNGNYERALALFRQAYSLSPRPGLLYNIAQTLDRLRRDEETLQALRDYRDASPEAPNIPEVEARIRVLEAEVARNANNGNNGGTTTTTPTDNGLAILHPAIFIAGAALTLGSAGVLIWSGLETMSLNDLYNGPTTDRNNVEARYNAANDQQLLTNVFIAVTSVLGAATVAFAVLTDWNAFSGGESAANTDSIRPVVLAGPGGAFLGLHSSF